MDINDITIVDLQPSQFYLSEKKIRDIKKWFNPFDLSNFEPVPIKLLEDKVIITDGHTRTFVAQQEGLSKIPLVWDHDELDMQAYQFYVRACKQRGVETIVDLTDRILSETDYHEKWIGWCETRHENE